MTWSIEPQRYGHDHRWGTAVHDINEQGVFVGGSGTTGSLERPPMAFMGSVRGGEPQELGSLLWRSTARAVNDAGIIVGWSSSISGAESLATLWRNGQAVDMNGLLDPVFAASGWTLTSANDINEAGLILADGRNASGGRGLFILTPVPEPTTLALMLLGAVGVIASTGRHRATARRS
jgi:probable HAF family extracellular repeat protein